MKSAGPTAAAAASVSKQLAGFIRLPTLAQLRSPDVLKLIRAAVAQAKTPLPTTGRGYTVIKSISAKQRPRRKIKPTG